MKKYLLSLFSILLFSFQLYAQQEDTLEAIQLDSVIVTAFEQNKRLRDVPAAVGYVGRQTLERFSSASIVNAINTIPGVRMEERSPGSYRFNIRGSSLRSPFGVRNVKVYYNDLPYTDPGGHTYLNGLGYYNINSIEIIKGPGSSLYGAGTGGVLLIDAMNNKRENGVSGEYAIGSFGLQNVYASFTSGNDVSKSQIGFQHQQSDGYRDHSALRKDVLSWNGNFHVTAKGFLKSTFLYSDLFYKTPGALTLEEFKTNPKGARPGGGGFPGSEAAKASINQKTFLAGASYTQELLPGLINKSVAYGAYTKLLNPTIRNYGRSSEPHVGGRTVFTYKHENESSVITLHAGAEIQQGFTSVSIHKNVNGHADSLQSYDEINNRLLTTFAQAEWDLNNWELSAGASLNWMKIRFSSFAPRPLAERRSNFSNEVAPRIAIMHQFKSINVYSSIAKGFSPPTTSELFPTGSNTNFDLSAEDGINYDAGVKGKLQKLTFDLNAFLFRLNNTIVQRRDAGGGDYFINAGKTKQYGVETVVNYPLLQNTIFTQSNLWASHTWHHFTYQDFKQQTTDFSGKLLPGVASHTVAAGFDFIMHNGILGAITYYYSDPIPLNDMNSAFANAYQLIGAKVGYQQWLKKVVRLKVVAGVDNLLDQHYSLGNDINAFGGRYYNSAAGRNYYASFIFQWKGK